MNDEILDENLDLEKQTISIYQKAARYILILLLGSIIAAYISNPSAFTQQATTNFLFPITLGIVFEGLRWLLRKRKGKIRPIRNPFWFEALENALAWWVILTTFYLITIFLTKIT